MTPPTAEQQLVFLTNIKRLLDEGAFVATYKYALLLALADLSVESGDDTGAPLALPMSAIAEKVLISYWRQACPYPGAAGLSTILKQNTGRQAAIVRLVVDAHAQTGGALAAANANTSIWTPLVAEVAEIVKRMPLWKLQRIGDHVLDFLYPNIQGHVSTLVPLSIISSRGRVTLWTSVITSCCVTGPVTGRREIGSPPSSTSTDGASGTNGTGKCSTRRSWLRGSSRTAGLLFKSLDGPTG